MLPFDPIGTGGIPPRRWFRAKSADDKVVMRNHRTATDAASGKKLEFRGIVIWHIASAPDLMGAIS